jgi:hypothetical protein
MVTVDCAPAKIPFPPPDFVINGRRYWKRRTLRAHRYRLELEKPHARERLPALPDDDDLVPSSVVKRENGGICDMTLWRWLHPERSKDSQEQAEGFRPAKAAGAGRST